MKLSTFIYVTMAFVFSNNLYAKEVKEMESIIPTLPGTIVSTFSETTPRIDGKTDALWSRANKLDVEVVRVLAPNMGAKSQVTIRSLYSKTHVYFNISWADDTQSVSHKIWTWNKDTKQYEQGNDREDMFALAFEKKGVFSIDMLAATEQTWDVWHWKASRTNPQGYSMDKRHIYTYKKPAGKARPYKSRNGKTIWIARPEDMGVSIEKKRKAPREYLGDKIAQYVTNIIPKGSSADVRAKGVWKDGRWTLEFARKLNTFNSDDTVFDIRKKYSMGLAPFNHTGDMDKSSGQLILTFKK